MARRFLLIDGYNLLNSAGLARDRYGPGEFERTRHRLLMTLALRLDADERARTTVVFDAALNLGRFGNRQQTFELMTVIFSPTGVDADSVIEELIAKHSSPKQLDVVSDDQRLRLAATRRRATPVSSDAFYEDLMDRVPLAPEATMEQTATMPQTKTAPVPASTIAPPVAETPRPVSNVSDKEIGRAHV